MFVTKLKRLSQTGDTIVEVLIVVAVLSSVLAGGYAIASSSLRSVQLTQERGYGLKLAEGQLEKLKSYDGTLPGSGAGFCFDSAGAIKTINGGVSSTDLNEVSTKYINAGCTHNPNDNGAACTEGYCYFYGVSSLGDNKYASVVRWEGPGGKPQQVILWYRTYP